MFQFRLAMGVARASGALLGGLTLALASQAAPVSYSGTFLHDNDLEQFAALDITSATGGTISAQTSSYAAGGFIPALVLFDSTGNELHRETAGASTCGGPPYCFDVGFSLSLSMGSYTLVLSQDGNLPLTGVLADGYIYDSDPTYTTINLSPVFPASMAPFVQFDGAQRTGNWAVTIDVTNNAVSGVPEPSGPALLAAAFGAWVVVRRRRAA